MMRLDRFLCETGTGTRSEVKQLIRKGLVTVNGLQETSPDRKVVEETDVIAVRGEQRLFHKFHYYLLHKPAGVITATRDSGQETVLDLLAGENIRNLFPVGRLDKDAEGFLLITDDGGLAHRLLSPKKHVDKTYFVRTKLPFLKQDAECLEAGVDIGDETRTLPARVEQLADNEINLTIREGRFHQVKRMLEAVGNEVVYLKRLSMGPLALPNDLKKGCFRPLNEEELLKLRQESLL